MKHLALDMHGALIEVEKDEPPLFESFKAAWVSPASSVYEPQLIPEYNESADEATIVEEPLSPKTAVSELPPFPDNTEDVLTLAKQHRNRLGRPPAMVLAIIGVILVVAASLYRALHPPTRILPIAIASPPSVALPMGRPLDLLRLRPHTQDHVRFIKQSRPSPRPSPLRIPKVAAPSEASMSRVVLRRASPLPIVIADAAVPSMALPKIFSVVASPTRIQRGQSSSICVNVRAYKIFLAPLGRQSRYPITCFPVRPTTTMTYAVVALDQYGKSIRRSITVTVSAPPMPPTVLAAPPISSPNPRGRRHRRRTTAVPTAMPTLQPTPPHHHE